MKRPPSERKRAALLRAVPNHANGKTSPIGATTGQAEAFPSIPTLYRLTLPYPPSSNRYWRVWRGRAVMSDEARAYKARVGLECARLRMTPITGEIAMSLHFYRPRKAGDLSNRIKVLEDALQGYAYEDDLDVAEIRADRFEDKANPRVEVWIGPRELKTMIWEVP